jgi:hypothetical protein
VCYGSHIVEKVFVDGDVSNSKMVNSRRRWAIWEGYKRLGAGKAGLIA